MFFNVPSTEQNFPLSFMPSEQPEERTIIKSFSTIPIESNACIIGNVHCSIRLAFPYSLQFRYRNSRSLEMTINGRVHDRGRLDKPNAFTPTFSIDKSSIGISKVFSLDMKRMGYNAVSYTHL